MVEIIQMILLNLFMEKEFFESKVKGQRSKVEGRRSKDEGQRLKVEGRRSKDEGQSVQMENFRPLTLDLRPLT